MARFYLHYRNHAEFVEDEEGAEFADAAEAEDQAVKGLRDILAGDVRSGVLNTSSAIEVEGENRQCVATILFEHVLRLDQGAADIGGRNLH